VGELAPPLLRFFRGPGPDLVAAGTLAPSDAREVA
jgi:hypothetical protein